jgi:DNA/RNA endonuclease YhcR with UshA esterase domain
MNTKRILIISIIIILIAIILSAVYLLKKNPKTNVCQSLGCPEDSIYVGSVNSDKYYVCDCQYAKRIKSENIICFSSDSEALRNNYTKVEC